MLISGPISAQDISKTAMSAVGKGDIETLKNCIEQGLNVNVLIGSEHEARSLLSVAAKQNKEEVVIFLIESGADVNLPNPNGETAIHFTLKSPRLLKLLIEKGANVNAQAYGDHTPIFNYLHEWYIEGLRILLENKADPNVMRKNVIKWGGYTDGARDEGATPLMQAAFFCQVEVAKLLIEFGANKKAKNNKRHTALDFAKHPYTCKWSATDLKILK